MKTYEIIEKTIFSPNTGADETKFVIRNNENRQWPFFGGYDFMGSVDWENDILIAYYMDRDEAEQIVRDLESADEECRPEVKPDKWMVIDSTEFGGDGSYASFCFDENDDSRWAISLNGKIVMVGSWTETVKGYLNFAPVGCRVPASWLPFQLGEAITNEKTHCKYIPIIEEVSAGSFRECSDGWVEEVFVDRCKIIAITQPRSVRPASEFGAYTFRADWNQHSRCEIIDCDDDLIKLVEEMEFYTGKKF